MSDIKNYDELIEYIEKNIEEVNRANIIKAINKMDDEVFTKIYRGDSWILRENIPVTGRLADISREKVRELIKQDLLDNRLAGLDNNIKSDDGDDGEPIDTAA